MSNKKKEFLLAGLAFLAICALAAYGGQSLEGSNVLVWYSIVPPLLAVTVGNCDHIGSVEPRISVAR